MRLGAWLRSGEGIGWLVARTMLNSLYRVPFLYIFMVCVLCYCCFLFVVLALFFVLFVIFSCYRGSFVVDSHIQRIVL